MKGIFVGIALAALVSTAPVADARQIHRRDRAWDFGAGEIGKVPAGWIFRRTNPPQTTDEPTGKKPGKTATKAVTWHVTADRTAPSDPNVLTVTKGTSGPATFDLAFVKGTSLIDVDLSVEIKPISGNIDQGGGLVWRGRDRNNYYVCRFNPLESNFRVYYVKNGHRHQLKSAHFAGAVGVWYALRVTMTGDSIVCYLEGKKLLEVTDKTFRKAGMIGLWTKADAVSSFDDLQVAPPRRRADSLLVQRQTIALPGVTGRLDHLTLDPTGNRLFLAALENGTVEVIDLSAGKRIRSIDGLSQPQGILYLPKWNRFVVACGGDGSVRSFDADTLDEVARCDLGGDADNIRFDAARDLLYVGFGNGALGILDAKSLTKKREIKVAGHPESFQLDSSNGRIYVNVPDAGRITVVDRKTRSVVAQWKTAGTSENYPMALDDTAKTLLVLCRKPPRLLAFDPFLGVRLATVACVEDADDIFFDHERKRIYAIGGEGFVDVFLASAGQRRSSRSAYPRLARVPTSPGARTALFVPERGVLYVAAPAREEQAARVLVLQAFP